MESLNQEQRLLLASALAAAWSDSELHEAEQRWIRLLAEVAGVPNSELDAFLQNPERTEAALSEQVAPQVAQRVLSGACDIVVADRHVKPDEERFLLRLGRKLGLSDDSIEPMLASLRELGARLAEGEA